jgi:hypothetical protein
VLPCLRRTLSEFHSFYTRSSLKASSHFDRLLAERFTLRSLAGLASSTGRQIESQFHVAPLEISLTVLQKGAISMFKLR